MVSQSIPLGALQQAALHKFLIQLHSGTHSPLPCTSFSYSYTVARAARLGRVLNARGIKIGVDVSLQLGKFQRADESQPGDGFAQRHQTRRRVFSFGSAKYILRRQNFCLLYVYNKFFWGQHNLGCTKIWGGARARMLPPRVYRPEMHLLWCSAERWRFIFFVER